MNSTDTSENLEVLKTIRLSVNTLEKMKEVIKSLFPIVIYDTKLLLLLNNRYIMY